MKDIFNHVTFDDDSIVVALSRRQAYDVEESRGAKALTAHPMPFEYDAASAKMFYECFADYYAQTREIARNFTKNSEQREPTEEDLEKLRQHIPSSNAQYRQAEAHKPLEWVIFNILLAYNKWTPQYMLKEPYALNESDLYYIFKEACYYTKYAISWPVYHIAAGIVFNELYTYDSERKCVKAPHVSVLDWQMFPALMLLLPALPEGSQVTLPQQDSSFLALDAYKLLVGYLKKEIPRIQWHEYNKHYQPRDTHILGVFPLENVEDSFSRLKEIKLARGGFIYTTWNFLTRAIHAKLRYKLLETESLRAIVQLPKLLRSGAKEYAAGIIVASWQRECTSLRMVHMTTSNRTGADLQESAQEALLLINSQEEKENISCFVPVQSIEKTTDRRLSPSFYMAQSDTEGKILGEYAQMLFYYKPRKKFRTEQEKEAILEKKRGLRTVNEISLSDMDASSSFVLMEEEKKVLVEIQHTDTKYLVEKGDIIFAYKGSEASLGRCALVVDALELTLSNQSTCILRPFSKTDTVWLYHQLRRPQVRDWLRKQASGTTSLVLSLETLKNLPLPPYNAQLAEDLNVIHGQMLEEYEKAVRSKKALRQSLCALEERMIKN